MKITLSRLRQEIREAIDPKYAETYMTMYQMYVDEPLMFSKKCAERLATYHQELDEKLLRYHRLIWEAVHNDIAQTADGKQKLREMLVDVESTYGTIVALWGKNSPPIDNALKSYHETLMPVIKGLIDEPFATAKPIEPEMSAAQRRAMIAKSRMPTKKEGVHEGLNAASPEYMRKEKIREELQALVASMVSRGDIADQASLDEAFGALDMSVKALKMVPFEAWQRMGTTSKSKAARKK